MSLYLLLNILCTFEKIGIVYKCVQMFTSSFAEGKEVSTNRRKRKRVLDNSQASMPAGADSALSTNQIPVMVCKHITRVVFYLHSTKILYVIIKGILNLS